MPFYRYIFVVSLITLVCFSLRSYAAEEGALTIGRYLTVVEKPLPGQGNLLSQTFQVQFPPSASVARVVAWMSEAKSGVHY